MIDLHTHTLFSDGELLPTELIQRAAHKGYTAIAITDHVDHSNIETVLEALSRVKTVINQGRSIKLLIGVEITHVAPQEIPILICKARSLGADIVNVHGETIVEPVQKGTNRAAIMGGADVLAHPGLITDRDAQCAAKHGIYFEVTTRKGHCLTNGHVVKQALTHGVPLVINTDAHAPGDLVSQDEARAVLLGAGLEERQCREVFQNSQILIKKLFSRLKKKE